MYCAKCGGLVEETAVYCPYCGNIFSVAEIRRQNRLPYWMLLLAGASAFTSVAFALLPYFKSPPQSAPAVETAATPALSSAPPLIIPTIVQAKPSPKLTSTPAPAPPTPKFEQTFNKIMRGTINDRFPIEMALRRRGATLNGAYFYTNQRINISLEGTIDQGRNVNLNGYDRDGTWIDVFRGRFISDSELVGTWSKPNGERAASFRLQEIH